MANAAVKRVVARAKKAIANAVAKPRATPAKKAQPAKKAPARAARVSAGPDAGAVTRTLERLAAIHPDAHCELVHADPFQLLCATVLSAQTTDVAVNKITPALFAKYPNAAALAAAEPIDVEPILSTIGMFRQKSKNIVGLARKLVEKHGGEVPRTLAELVELPGVGRKTANVVLGVAFGAPEGVVVDTHVQRIAQRLGWTRNVEPVTIEQDLCALLPRDRWDQTSHVLIFHGRRVCFARKPDCAACGVNDTCPSAFEAENVGRKAGRGPRTGARGGKPTGRDDGANVRGLSPNRRK
jgi:endonuclease-3